MNIGLWCYKNSFWDGTLRINWNTKTLDEQQFQHLNQ